MRHIKLDCAGMITAQSGFPEFPNFQFNKIWSHFQLGCQE